MESGQCKRLMMFVPPRHGKSMLTSEHFPPWYLGRNPDRFVVCASYGQELADDFGRSVRQQMMDPLYAEIFPGCSVDPESASVSRISTQQNGKYFAVGIGGPLVGRGAHVLVVDDPVKDREAADSYILRKRCKQWYQSAAYTRLMPGGAIVVMHTRWHEDDLAGWLLREHGDEGWEIINITAEPPPWPEAFPAERLDAIRKAIGPREWTAQFMQSPVPGGGGIFTRDQVKYYKTPPSEIGGNNYILVDPAGENRADKDNDYTAIWVIAIAADGNYYWVDGIRDRLELPARGKEIMRLHRKWRPIEVRYERYGMQGDIQYLTELQERENYRFNVVEVAGRLKKEDRIRRLQPMFQEGKFYAPVSLTRTDAEGVPHDLVEIFIEQELVAFPAGLHDDMLDSLARIAEPDLPLIWPRGETEHKSDRYNREHRTVSAWAA